MKQLLWPLWFILAWSVLRIMIFSWWNVIRAHWSNVKVLLLGLTFDSTFVFNLIEFFNQKSLLFWALSKPRTDWTRLISNLPWEMKIYSPIFAKFQNHFVITILPSWVPLSSINIISSSPYQKYQSAHNHIRMLKSTVMQCHDHLQCHLLDRHRPRYLAGWCLPSMNR